MGAQTKQRRLCRGAEKNGREQAALSLAAGVDTVRMWTMIVVLLCGIYVRSTSYVLVSTVEGRRLSREKWMVGQKPNGE